MPGAQQPGGAPAAPELSAHDAAMVAKADAVAAAGVPAGVMPAGKDVPTEVDPQKEPEVTPEVPPVVPPADSKKAPEQEALKDAGLDITAVQAEFNKDGKLSDASFAALEKAGYPKATVEVHIEGLRAIQTLALQDAHATAGGEQSFKAMAAWASANLDAAAQEAFDAGVVGTKAARTQAILGLKAAYEAAQGTAPKLVFGGNGAQAGVLPFASQAEVSAAMRNPLYRTDPAYQAQVVARLGVSTAV